MDQPALFDKRSFVKETIFHFKAFVLTRQRWINNLVSALPKAHTNDSLADLPIISVSESQLWNDNDTPDNWVLTAGKIQNLRIAAKKINGIEISPGQVFSFWKCVGKPSRLKGYVIGREIREGCIVPTIAGGLCQLSNALYDAALKAGFKIIERHKHTQVIKGSLAEQNRDATVKWNYIDLRFNSGKAFRIEVELTSEKLIIKFRSNNTAIERPINFTKHSKASKLNDCYSCGNYSCFKHPNPNSTFRPGAITTYVLDEKWAEYDKYIKQHATDNDFFIVPLHQSKFISSSRYNWTIKNKVNLKKLPFVAIDRAIRLGLFKNSNLFKLMLGFDKRLAKAASKYIPIESTHLVISQNLLPFMFEQGALGGRTFDVLMNRLPFEQLHQTLDMAHAKYTNSKTLSDFRAPELLIDVENMALTKAEHIITPHQQIADIFNNKAIKLNWVFPPANNTQLKGTKVLFPASALGRKGAYEIKELAQQLNLTIVVTGKATEYDNFWGNVKIEMPGSNIFDGVGLVIYPAYIEHRPLVLLRALAAGIPVITTQACGLQPTQNLTILPTDNFELLKQAVKAHFIN